MTTPVELDVDAGTVRGDLTVPADARGVVVFAHGAGSSRRSPRNIAVAKNLQDDGLATLLFDLLTEREERGEQAGGALRFDVALLSGRLLPALDTVAAQEGTRGLPVGLFGASTGAAAALSAAAAAPQRVHAVVSRGGRPDLAGTALGQVRAPTRLIVGGRDRDVLRLNEQAAAHLTAPHDLEVVAGASHLFEEPGTLEQVAELARDWFGRYLSSSRAETTSGRGA